MTTHVAFLRGINVGGHDRMEMDELRQICEALGLRDVRTYSQSGNVVFEAPGADPVILGDELEGVIDREFGYDVTVVIRTREELEAVVEGQPFEEPTDDTKLSVTFLQEAPGEDQVEELLAAGIEAETFVVRGREVYSELDGAQLGDGRFTDVGKRLGMPTTQRNWDVVREVLELASAESSRGPVSDVAPDGKRRDDET